MSFTVEVEVTFGPFSPSLISLQGRVRTVIWVTVISPPKYWEVLREPVPVLGQQVPLDAVHEVFKPGHHRTSLVCRLGGDHLVPQILKIKMRKPFERFYGRNHPPGSILHLTRWALGEGVTWTTGSCSPRTWWYLARFVTFAGGSPVSFWPRPPASRYLRSWDCSIETSCLQNYRKL